MPTDLEMKVTIILWEHATQFEDKEKQIFITAKIPVNVQ